MTQQLILHIGHPKTGTTTLQKTLQASRPALLAEGILHPDTGPHHNHKILLPYLTGNYLASQTPASQLRKTDPTSVMLESSTKWASVLQDIRKHDPNTIILSSEQLFRVTNSGELQNLAGLIKPIAPVVVIAAYLREPASATLSTAQQLLKSQPGFKMLPKDYFRRSLEPYTNCGLGSMKVRVFDRSSLEGGDIVKDFFKQHAPAFVSNKLTHHKDENTTVSPEAMALMQEINRMERSFPSIKAFKKIMNAIDTEVEGYSRPCIHDYIRHAMHARCTDLGWLEDKFGLVFPNVDTTAMSESEANRVCDSLDLVKDICEIDADRKEKLWHAACKTFS